MSEPFEQWLRGLIEDVIRRVVREELGSQQGIGAAGVDPNQLMSIRAVAQLVGVSTNTVRSWIAKGLPTCGLGRVVRVKRLDLDRFWKEHVADSGPDPNKHAAEILGRRRRR